MKAQQFVKYEKKSKMHTLTIKFRQLLLPLQKKNAMPNSRANVFRFANKFLKSQFLRFSVTAIISA